ncbi:MAG TPA: glycoside hydrolase family 16 protein [Paucimonas sp.]|nr:glycoside hydrolase family 16 protein [Paucimonas sp.]
MLKTTFNRCYLRALACSTIAVTLAACGGGGGADGSQLNTAGMQSTSPDSGGTVTTGGVSGAGNNTGNPSSGSGSSSNGSANGSTDPAPAPAPGPAPTPAPTPAPVPAPTPAPEVPPPTVPAPTSPATTPGPFGQDARAYTLAFADEFESGLNPKVWNDHIWYEKANATKNYTVENGALKIWPQRDASGKFFNRTIDTDGKYYQTYGYFEIEAKLPVGKGTWPAFWLFNHIGSRRPEIDIMEAYAGGTPPWGTKMSDGQPHPTMYAATVWRTIDQQVAFKKIPTSDLSAGFHKYALKWEPNKMTFYFDGRAVYTANISMSDPMYLMLDLWYGSASGQPDNTTPQGKSNSYEVRYVRAWKFK